MQNTRLQALEELAKRKARSSLASFTLYTYPGYLMGWFHREICEALDEFLEAVQRKESPRLLIDAPPRSGKLCADNTPVLTTKGWKQHGDLVVGDYVYSPTGQPVRVLAVGQKDYASHEVVFSNGEAIAVHLDHEWQIYSRLTKGYKVVETRYFTEPCATGKTRSMTQGIIGQRGGRYVYSVDRAKALQNAEQKHVIPPYVLGAWLGDGTAHKPCLSMSREDADVLINEFNKLGVKVQSEWVHKQTGVVTFSFADKKPGVRNKFSQALKDLCLLDNKHIPDEYLTDSLHNRLELLAGLLDTDGTFDKHHGRYTFTTIYEHLALQVQDLARSCGYVANLQKRPLDTRDRKIKATKPIFSIDFTIGDPVPCRLERKQGTHKRVNRRLGIVEVRPLQEKLRGNCIQVDSPDGLYLVGKSLITTHNSQLVSREFPAYILGKYPDTQIIACSYSADLTSRMNRDVQRIIDSKEYHDLFATYLAGKEAAEIMKDSDTYARTSDLFEVVGHKGSYRSTGVGGGVTGSGADVFIIDDPFKDRAEANSLTIRQKVWDWYTSTAYTRLSPGGGIIVMNTRWHMDDLVGRLLREQAEGGDVFKHISYPAIAEHDEKHRKAGEALHPERYDVEQLMKIKAAVGPRDWSALYQQRPVPDGGGLFKDSWLQYYKDLPANLEKVVMSWDMTFKDTKGSDYVVGSIWARKGGNFYLVDQVRGRWDFVTTLEKFIAFCKKHSTVNRKLVEDKANGTAIINTLKKHISGIIPITPTESKESRASAIATLWEAHNVYLPSPDIAPWVKDFTAELLEFPAGAHDDQVDSMTQALNDLQKGGRISIESMTALRLGR